MGRSAGGVDGSPTGRTGRSAPGSSTPGVRPRSGRGAASPPSASNVRNASRGGASPDPTPCAGVSLSSRSPPSEVVQRVEAQSSRRPSYLDQAHLDRASLVSSYAALNAVTAMGATYTPGPEAEDPRVRAAWARELNRIGGMEDLSQELTQIERGLARQPGGTNTPALRRCACWRSSAAICSSGMIGSSF